MMRLITAQFTGCSRGQKGLLPHSTQHLTRYTMAKYAKGNTYAPLKHKVSAITGGITVKLIPHSSGNGGKWHKERE